MSAAAAVVDPSVTAAQITAFSTLGAVLITLIGTGVVQALREGFGKRREARERRHDDVGAALLAFHAALGDLLSARVATPMKPTVTAKELRDLSEYVGRPANLARASGFDIEPVLARLTLLLTSKQQEVGVVARQAIAAVMQVKYNGQGVDPGHGERIWRAFLDVSTAWYRGDIKNDEVKFVYHNTVHGAE